MYSNSILFRTYSKQTSLRHPNMPDILANDSQIRQNHGVINLSRPQSGRNPNRPHAHNNLFPPINQQRKNSLPFVSETRTEDEEASPKPIYRSGSNIRVLKKTFFARRPSTGRSTPQPPGYTENNQSSTADDLITGVSRCRILEDFRAAGQEITTRSHGDAGDVKSSGEDAGEDEDLSESVFIQKLQANKFAPHRQSIFKTRQPDSNAEGQIKIINLEKVGNQQQPGQSQEEKRRMFEEEMMKQLNRVATRDLDIEESLPSELGGSLKKLESINSRECDIEVLDKAEQRRRIEENIFNQLQRIQTGELSYISDNSPR